MANMAAGEVLYDIRTLSTDGAGVVASSGIRVMPDASLEDIPAVDTLFVIGSNPVSLRGDKSVLNGLRCYARQGVALGGVCTGSYTLARAGLLDGYRCTIHWEDMGQLIERFPKIIVSPNLYEIDRDRLTCSGGTAAVDMMLALISVDTGNQELAAKVAELMIYERIRGSGERQRMPLRLRLGSEYPRLTAAVALMEANVEDPLNVDELASMIAVSRRQLERLFHDYLGTTPSRYYLHLRFEQARRLLRRSDRSVTEIANTAGFAAASHFSTRYRDLFGCSPSAERRPSSLREIVS